MRLFAHLFYVSVAVLLPCQAANEGYVTNNVNGFAYRLVYRAQTWEVSRDMCRLEHAKLAVPKSEEEFLFLQKMVRGMHYPSIINGSDYKLLVWLGISNLDDYSVWRNVDGENIYDTGYHEWAGHNGEAYSDAHAEPHCVGLDAINRGLRDYWCHRRQPYICQRSSGSPSPRRH